MKLKNGLVFGSDFKFEERDISFSHVIGDDADGEEMDVKGLYVLPAFLDIHTHGAVGYDAIREDFDIEKHRDFMYENGVLNYFPTTMAESLETIEGALSRLGEADFITGINLEGPYLSEAKRGAHETRYIREADLKTITDFQKAAKGKIRITTVAPEVGCNLEMIPTISKMGIKVSLGHTACDYATANIGFDNGATHVTHLFNAMSPLGHRSSGLIGAAFDRDDVYCEVISDGIHLAPEIVRLIHKVKGSDKMVLISDSMCATGFSDGRYNLGTQNVTVTDSVARTDDGAIAGSTKNLRQMVKSAISFGISKEEAIKMATYTPAKAVGLDNELGTLDEGKKADVIVCDTDLEVKLAFKDGKLVYKK